MLSSSTPPPMPADVAPSGALTVGQLRALVSNALESVLVEGRPKEPVLLTREQLAAALQISPSKLHDLRKERNFPEIQIGDVPRFRLEAVLAWLENNARDE